MKRWIVRAAACGLASLCCGNPLVAQDAYDELSPSDLRITSSPVAEPDSEWIRGLDDLSGSDDIIGSGSQRGTTGAYPVPYPPADSAGAVGDYAQELYGGSYASGCQPGGACGSCNHCLDETPITRFRQSAYQGSSISGGFLGDGDLGLAHYNLAVRFAVPIDGMDNVVIIAPSIRHDVVNSSGAIDLPSNLYDAGVNFTWRRKLSERWNLMAMATPSIRSDFQTSNDAFRLFGLGLLTYDWVPNRLSISMGAVYLDRDDIPLLPALGFTWTPTPLWRVEANFPRPRIARRIDKQGALSESWIYSGVALGGNTWAVERANGTDDVLNIRDIQWVFGWEHIREGGRGLFFEAGAAFGRSVEYESTGQEVDFDDSLFFRGGITL